MNKQFNKEMLEALSRESDALNQAELLDIKQKIFSAIAAETKSDAAKFPAAESLAAERRSSILRYAIATLLGLSLIGGTAFAAGGSKPGELLYPIKRATEKARLAITLSEVAKANLKARFARERLKELAELNAESPSPVNGGAQVSIGLNASSTAGSSTEPASSQARGGSKDDKTRIKLEATAETQAEVNDALSALKNAQVKLEAKGTQEAAAALGENLLRLRNKAHDQSIILNDENDGRGKGQRKENGRGEDHLNLELDSSSTLNSNFFDASTTVNGLSSDYHGDASQTLDNGLR
jgi:hypothetical protein